MTYDTLIPTVKLRVEKRVQLVNRPLSMHRDGAQGGGTIESVLVDVLQQWWSVSGQYVDDRGVWLDVPVEFNVGKSNNDYKVYFR